MPKPIPTPKQVLKQAPKQAPKAALQTLKPKVTQGLSIPPATAAAAAVAKVATTEGWKIDDDGSARKDPEVHNKSSSFKSNVHYKKLAEEQKMIIPEKMRTAEMTTSEEKGTDNTKQENPGHRPEVASAVVEDSEEPVPSPGVGTQTDESAMAPMTSEAVMTSPNQQTEASGRWSGNCY